MGLRGAIVAAFVLLVGICPLAVADGLPSNPSESMTLAAFGVLCPADAEQLGDDPPVRAWLDRWQRIGFCEGVHAGTISFVLSPQYDDRLTGYPDDDRAAEFCGWLVLGSIELVYGGYLGSDYRTYLAEHADLGGEPAVPTLQHALPEIYPCDGAKDGPYQLDLEAFRALCTGQGARLTLLTPGTAQTETAVLYVSLGYCQGLLYGWIQAMLTADRDGAAPYCLPNDLTLAEIHLALVDELNVRPEQAISDVPVPAALDGVLKEILPCT